MSQDEHLQVAASAGRAANVDAAWTLVRWVGIPIVLVAAIYFIQRTYDERPYVVVTDHGAMPSAEQIAATPSATQPTQAPPSSTAPLIAPPPSLPVPAQPLAPPIILQPVSQPSPPYPARALDAEREGTVRLRLNIAPDGSVSEAVAIRGEPPGWFERAAEMGARRWRYAPPGRAMTTEVDVEFKLK